jgi:hypothetical protein
MTFPAVGLYDVVRVSTSFKPTTKKFPQFVNDPPMVVGEEQPAEKLAVATYATKLSEAPSANR